MRKIALALTLVAAGTGSSWAAGTITGVSANPPSATVGEPVDITVEGTGTCDLTVDFGDGESVTLNNAVMPRTVTHTYTAIGTVTAFASAPDCPEAGKPDVEILVRYRIGPAPPDRGPLVYVNPTILGTLGFGVAPGMPLFLDGVNFGDTQGTVRIVGPNGEFKALEVEQWYDDAIAGMVPEDINEICVIGVRVETAEGELSAIKDVHVPLAVKALTKDDVAVVSCGDDGDTNRCNDVDPGTEDAFPCTGAWLLPFGSFVEMISQFDEIQVGVARPAGSTPVPPTAIAGAHRNCWGAIHDDSDDDTYRITLRNGWVLDSADFFSGVITGDEDQGSTTPPSGSLPAGFVPGASSWEPTISWTVSGADTIGYGMRVFIRGPACASHK